MTGPPVVGGAVVSPVLLIGQAPGPREIVDSKPFAWTAGKTLFGWFASIGIEEHPFRDLVYMAAACRCFPGKNTRGGDRVPDSEEVANCAGWLKKEVSLLRPQLVLPVGKLAISQLITCGKLVDVVGRVFELTFHDVHIDAIPLPHPSGASTWHRTEPGRTLLRRALTKIRRHSAWKTLARMMSAPQTPGEGAEPRGARGRASEH